MKRHIETSGFIVCFTCANEQRSLISPPKEIQTFTEAIANHKASRSAHVAASQLIDAAIERARIILAQLDPIMENKLGENMALQLKWQNVRRVERRWIYKTPKEETPLRPAA